MTRYKLAHDLPTYKKGEIFILDDEGNLRRESDGIPAYMRQTIERFPAILTEWFVPTVRDGLTKEAFKKYLDENPDQRFFQAVRNFTQQYISSAYRIEACYYKKDGDEYRDTFYWECDDMMLSQYDENDNRKLMNASCGMDDFHKYGKED